MLITSENLVVIICVVDWVLEQYITKRTSQELESEAHEPFTSRKLYTIPGEFSQQKNNHFSSAW